MTAASFESVSNPCSTGGMDHRHRLAAALQALRHEAGCPSYARLYRLSPVLPPATISGVLNAKSAPRLEFVLAFVEAVCAYAETRGIALDPRERNPETWRRRWLDLHVVPALPTTRPEAVSWLHEAQALIGEAICGGPDTKLIRAAWLLGATMEVLAGS